jgi:rod shape-determining protein MreD
LCLLRMKNLKKNSQKISFNEGKRRLDINKYTSVLLDFCGRLYALFTNLRIRNSLLKVVRRYPQQLCALSILFIIALSQYTLFNYFRIFNVKPNVILAALIMLVPFFSLGWSVAFAFLSGILRDIFSGLPFGLELCLCIIWIILAKQIFRRLSPENNLIRSVILCLIIVLNNFATQSVLFVLDRSLSLDIFLKIVSIESILTLILALPIYRLFVYLFMPE